MRLNRFREKAMQGVFFLTAVTSIAAVVIICIFLFCNGVPAMAEIGFFDFVGGQKWAPTNVPASYGIFDMIIASIYVTAGAIIIGVPIGILTAVFLARFCPAPLYKVLKPATELLAGIPSIVYGFFGLMVVVPFIRDNFGGNGSSWLAASIVLGVMILPTIIGVSESAIKAVPESYYEGALALGATKERSVFKTSSGIKIRRSCRSCSRHRQSVGRNNGSCTYCRQSGSDSAQRYGRTSYPDRKHCS